MADEIVHDGGELIPFLHGESILKQKHSATLEEIAMWISRGDLKAYSRTGKRINPLNMTANHRTGKHCYELLADARFSKQEIESFVPAPDARFLNFGQVISRAQSVMPDKSEAEIKALIQGKQENPNFAKPGALVACHPVDGIADDIEQGMFWVWQVEDVIQREWAGLNPETVNKGRDDEGLPDLWKGALPEFMNAEQIAMYWLGRWGDGEGEKEIAGRIAEAVRVGALKADVSIRKPGAVGGYEVISSPSILSQIRNGRLDGAWVEYTIHREAFREWLQKSGQWPLSKCPLSRWFGEDAAIGVDEKVRGSAVANLFSKFENLRSNMISLVMKEDGTATFVIGGKKIKASPSDFGLKEDSQGWGLLQTAAVYNGKLAEPLKKLNTHRDREKGKAKVKTVVTRLRKTLKESMGLKDDPIPYTRDSGYKFAFRSMTHELLNGDRTTKGRDAMDYLDDERFEDNQYGRHDSYFAEDDR